jgi:hypothetical protein
MLPFGPQLYLIAALVAALPVTYGVMSMKREFAVKEAYITGVKAGQDQAAAAVTKSATETVVAVTQGEAEAPTVPPDKVKIIELCKRSASCRDRGRLAVVSRETEPRK